MNQKPLIIFCGLSGTGKTFNSKILESRLAGYSLINIGDIREKLGITSYSRKDTPKLLAMAIEHIEQNHKKGIGSILDANLKSVDLRQCFYDLAKELGIKAVIIQTACSDSTTRLRMSERKQENKAENPKNYNIYLEQKKLWQDLDLDIAGQGNAHVTFAKLDTEQDRIKIIKLNENYQDDLKKITAILEDKNKTLN